MKTECYFINYVLIFTLLCMIPFKTMAFEYQITFTASGESTSVDSVIAQNLTKGTSITVPGGQALVLYDIETLIAPISTMADNVTIYPNPLSGEATFSFVTIKDGNTQIMVYGIDGKKVVGMDIDLQQGINSFQLKLPNGVYLIQAKGTDYSYSAKAISLSLSQNEAKINFIGFKNNDNPQRISALSYKLQYSVGDQMLYKAISGIYSTIVTDVPANSKTTNFEFVDCTDADGNHYTVVKIGTQTWMAENLKTTKYRNGENIENVTAYGSAWVNLIYGGWCNYDNDEAKGLKYGKLYNWLAANGSRKIAPEGWHVPSNFEWIELVNYVVSNPGTSIHPVKALASTTDWMDCSIYLTIGHKLNENNSTGFSALPGGMRTTDGNFGQINQRGRWWTSTLENIYNFSRYLSYDSHGVEWGVGYESGYRAGGLSVRCLKDPISCPTLTTSFVTSVGQVTATSGGNFTSDGGAEVTARGVCWSTNQNPTIADSKTTDGTGTGTFTSSITGLTANTSYYVRAYATNSEGTCYGEEVIFKTKDYTVENCGTVTDIDGNVYQTVNIGGKCWMAENLRTTKYRNGDAIPNVTDGTTWTGLTTGAWCAYNNNISYATTYGLLYNWFTVIDSRGLAPEGWHVASLDEWEEMANYLIANGYNYDGTTIDNKIGKAVASISNWWNNSVNGTVGNNQAENNKSGLNIPPAGARHYTSSSFVVMGAHANIYTSTEYNTELARVIGLYYDGNYLNLSTGGGGLKYQGASVRCLKD